MFLSHRDDIEGKKFSGETVKGVTKQVLIGAEQGWEDYVMRLFTVEPGGYSPRHAHEWPHIIYIVEGEGTLHVDGKDNSVRAGSVAFVDGGKEHQLTQRGNGKFVFMCIVPPEGDK